MAELATDKLNADSHVAPDNYLVRVPYELSKRNLRSARTVIEKFQSDATTAIESAQRAALKPTPTDEKKRQAAAAAVASIDAVLVKAQGLKRKLETLQTEERSLQAQHRARLQHLQEIHEIPSLTDVRFDRWSRTRLDRMLVDKMLRFGQLKSARMLAEQRGIWDLCDVDAFVAMAEVENSLKNGRTAEALAWCAENRRALKEVDSRFELELRLQQMIEMARSGDTSKLVEATLHARKYLGGHQDTSYGLRAGGLLAYPSYTLTDPYRALYSERRWQTLADDFTSTYERIFSLPMDPLLCITLNSGLSALKTPACHSAFASSSSNALSTTTSVCPICSTELNELARTLPNAHHSKSYVESDPVVLPNGRIYGRERLLAMNEKLGTPEGKIRDPTNVHQEYDLSEIKKVFIS